MTELFSAPTKYLLGLVEFTQLKCVYKPSRSKQHEVYTGAQGCTKLSQMEDSLSSVYEACKPGRAWTQLSSSMLRL